MRFGSARPFRRHFLKVRMRSTSIHVCFPSHDDSILEHSFARSTHTVSIRKSHD